MILAKITDDLMFAGSIEDMECFVAKIKQRFDVIKAIFDGPLLFNGCMINQSNNGDITMDMYAYMETIQQLEVSRARRKQPD